jgi:hypothetical protein
VLRARNANARRPDASREKEVARTGLCAGKSAEAESIKCTNAVERHYRDCVNPFRHALAAAATTIPISQIVDTATPPWQR